MSSNNRLYLYEWTPTGFKFVGTAVSYPPDLSPATTIITIQTHTPDAVSSRAFKCVLPDLMATVYWDADDTQLHWEGEFMGPGGTLSVQAQYAYLTGAATWTAYMPALHRKWVFGTQSDGVVIGAPFSSRHRRARMVSIPSDEYIYLRPSPQQ